MTPPAVIPEIFNRESTFLLFPLCPSIGKDRACPLPLYRFLIETLRNPSPPSFPKFFIGNPKAFAEEEEKIHRGFPLPLFRFLIEPFRNDR